MFDTYTDIFNMRGQAYHLAMARWPMARKEEFDLILRQAQLKPGQIVCDMPSGGGYLKRFLPKNCNIELLQVESSKEFYDSISEDIDSRRYLCDLDKVPLNSASIDTIISLAGMHHVEDRIPIFSEMNRLLKSNGRLCFADVAEGTEVGNFLNIFVHKYSSSGHQGLFVDGKYYTELLKSGFDIISRELCPFYWHFDSIEDMVGFCSLLFGIDRASHDQVLNGIDKYPGYVIDDQQCYLNWELEFITCEKSGAVENK